MQTPTNNLQTRISADLRPIEASDSRIGGAHLTTPSGIEIAALWREAGLIGDTLATAKACAAQLLDKLQRDHAGTDIERINWPSVVAAIQALVQRWNDARRSALYAEHAAATHPQLGLAAGDLKMGPVAGSGDASGGEGATH